MEWINVKDKLPDVSGNVLVKAINSKKEVYVWIYHFSTMDYNFVGNDAQTIKTDVVTHWMNLPK